MWQRRNVRRIPCRVQQLVCCAAFTVLQACQQAGPDAAFEIYLKALSSALSATTPSMKPTRVPRIPGIGEWQLDIPASGIDGLDILQVSGCAVQANIGKRQTSLGQSAKPSQRLMLELEYLRLAPACITRLQANGNDGPSAILQQAWHEKQAQLPALIFNATLGSDEYRAFWLTRPAPGDYPRVSATLASSALKSINDEIIRWQDGDYDANNRDFELLLSEVAGGNAGTQLQDWTRQIDWLATANDMAERQLVRGTLCAEYTPRLVTLIARARKDFTDAIEPLTIQSQNRYQLMTAEITKLETHLRASLPEPYRRWMSSRNQHALALGSAASRHMDLLHRLQQACTSSSANRAHSLEID